VTFILSPWANQQIVELRERFNQREDVSMVAPGQFRESTSSNRVFFVESMSADRSTVSNVFVVQHNADRMVVVASRGGNVRIEPNGDRFLVLEDGRRYDGTWGTAEYALMEFLHYGVRLDPKPVNTQIESARGMPTLDLLQQHTPAARGELAYRIGLPLSVFITALLAIPLSGWLMSSAKATCCSRLRRSTTWRRTPARGTASSRSAAWRWSTGASPATTCTSTSTPSGRWTRGRPPCTA